MTTTWLLALLATAPTTAPAAEAPDTAVVCPEQFVPALRPWLVHRAAQGHRFALISNEQSADQILAEIRGVAGGGRLRYVVLIGDDEPAAHQEIRIRRRCVPAFRARARVNVQYGGEPLIATDAPYGDLDGDGQPDVAVGRLTADSSIELQRIVEKILRYETESGFGPWRRRINFVAGVGGFGMMADAVIEMSAKRLITEGVPPGFETSMTYGSWRSPYCPDPRRFHQATVDRLNEGCLFWVYIGHGQRTYLDWVKVPGRTYHILDYNDIRALNCREGLPIAVMLSCNTAAFDKPQDCLAEEMLRCPGAPVAVVGATRVAMPYAMTVLATAMLDEYFVNQRETLGDVVHAAKLRLLSDGGDDPRRKMVDSIASLVSPAPQELGTERAEHVLLFHIIGDPLLKLQHPQAVGVQVAEYAAPGKRLDVDIVSPLAGDCRVELVCRRDRTTFRPALRPQYDASDTALARYTDIYRQANNHQYVARRLVVEPGSFHTQLDVPSTAQGPCHVRVYVAGPGGHASGAADVYVRRTRTRSEGDSSARG